MNTISINLRVVSQKQNEFIQTVQSLQLEMKKDHRVSRSSLYQDMEDANIFQLINEWEVYHDYEGYLNSHHFRILIGALKLLSEETDVRYRIHSPKPGKKILEVSGS